VISENVFCYSDVIFLTPATMSVCQVLVVFSELLVFDFIPKNHICNVSMHARHRLSTTPPLISLLLQSFRIALVCMILLIS